MAGKKPGTKRLIDRNPWNLTDAGKGYGIMQDSAKEFANSKWEGFQILWSSKTIEVIKDYIVQNQGVIH